MLTARVGAGLALMCAAAAASGALPTVVAGGHHTFAIKSQGGLLGWGRNSSGQLGDGSNVDRITPIQIGVGYTAVSGGGALHARAQGRRQPVGMGSNSSGQLGDSTTANRIAPLQVGAGFSAIAAGESHSAGVKADGSLWTLGSNSNGQLGNGLFTNEIAPAQEYAANNGYLCFDGPPVKQLGPGTEFWVYRP